MKNRVCMCLDLVADEEAIREYEQYHEPQNIWPEITKSIRDAGVKSMEIYRCRNRLFMIMEVADDFSLENKARLDADNPKVQEWEALMQAKFQQALPWQSRISWEPMNLIFELPKESF